MNKSYLPDCVDKNIHSFIKDASLSWQHQVALTVMRDNSLSSWKYFELFEQSTIFSLKLKTLGINRGDRVILLSDNSPDMVIALFSILEIGATVILLDPTLPTIELKKLILRVDSCGLISADKYLSVIKDISADYNFNYPVLKLNHNLELFENIGSHISLNSTPDPDFDVAVIIFTSGTTGNFKGVKITHENIINVINDSYHLIQANRSDVVLAILPMYHIFALSLQILAILHSGGKLCFLETLDSNSLSKAMQNFKPTILMLVPRLLDLLAKKITTDIAAKNSVLVNIANATGLLKKMVKNKFGGKVRVILSGGAPLSNDTANIFSKFDFRVLQGYGLTETAGLIAGNGLAANKTGTVGRLIENVQVNIENPDVNGEGEICFKGKNLMRGYFRDELATNEVIKDGWFYTGDVGKISDDGFLTLTGRSKDIVVTPTGKKFSYHYIESFYQDIPGVDDIAIVSIPLENKLHEILYAAVKINHEYIKTDLPESNIQANIYKRAEGLASYLQVKKILFLPEIPKTNIFKIKYFQVKQQIIRQLSSSDVIELSQANARFESTIFASAKEEQIAVDIKKQIAYLVNIDNIQISFVKSISQYGADSLIFMELTNYINEKYNVSLEMSFFTPETNIYHLVSYIVKLPQISKSNMRLTGNDAELKADFDKKNSLSLGLRLFISFSKVVWKLKVNGIENFSQNMPYIICPNHSSYLDPFWVLGVLPKEIAANNIALAKKELWDNFVTRKILMALNAIAVDRFGDISRSFNLAKQSLQNGKSILVFPEGTRSKNGQLGTFKNSAAKLSIETQVPIIPIAIIGGFDIYPPNHKFPSLFNLKSFKRYQLIIQIGKPILASGDTFNDQNVMTNKLRDAIAEMIN